MKAIAFYLPQFHVIPENEAVYGPGFTEWDNVRNARPLFPGHRQPRAPHGMLGYYSLENRRTLLLQHRLAMNYGVGAFCYYYYNFGGRRLLEKPLDIICRTPAIQNEFCLCWPHVSWCDNRRRERPVFLEQDYSEDAARLMARDLLRYFRHPRYIRMEGRPFFLIFAPERHPAIGACTSILREEAARAGLSLCLAGVEAYGPSAPQRWGLDCMVEFAPSWVPESMLSAPGEQPRRYDYQATVRFMLSKPVPPYTRLRCVFPGWDNTPRRGRYGLACTGVSPAIFRLAIEAATEYTRGVLPPSCHYVFINAWNEWGEGCCIEPDDYYGLRYLEAIREVMGRERM